MSIFDFSVFHEWLIIHKSWIGPSIGFVSFIETLAFIGYIVPGVPILFALGMLASTSFIPIWELFIWGVIGAVLGDSFSFQLGLYYQDRLRSWRLLQRYPQWLFYGEHFFKKYGVMSIVLGRFLGPVRPIIPVIAGMMNMNIRMFYVVNVISSFIWIPVYVFPGYFLGQVIHEFRDVFFYLLFLYSRAIFLSIILVALGLWVDKVTQRGYLMPFMLGVLMFIVSGILIIFNDCSFFDVGIDFNRQFLCSLEIPIVEKSMNALRILSQTLWLWVWTAMLILALWLYRCYMRNFCVVLIVFLVLLEVALRFSHLIMNSHGVGEINMEHIFPMHLSRVIFIWLCTAGVISISFHPFYRWLCFSAILVLFSSVAFTHYWSGTIQIMDIVIDTMLGVALYSVMISVQRNERYVLDRNATRSEV